MNGGVRGNAIEEVDLISSQSQGGQQFKIYLRQRLGGDVCNVRIQQRSPAQDSHHQLCREAVIVLRELFVFFRVQEFGGVGGGTLHTQQNFEGSCAGGRDGHC